MKFHVFSSRLHAHSVWLALIVLGCGAPLEPGGTEAPVVREALIRSTPIQSKDGKAVAHRLTLDQFAYAVDAAKTPYVIEPKSFAVGSLGERDRNAPPPGALTGVEDGKRVIKAAFGHCNLTALLSVQAAEYNTLTFTMSVDTGTQSLVYWTTDLEPSTSRAKPVAVPIFADGEMHTYRVSLSSELASTWAGRIRSLIIQPSDATADIVLESVKLSYERPEHPMRLTMGGETHEALVGTQLPWELTVPPNATFETYLGIPEDLWAEDRDAQARFVVTLESPGAEPVTLVNELLTPKSEPMHQGWLPIQAGLSDYAGKTVRITCAIEHTSDPNSTYGCWGNPMVFAADPASEAIPVVLISCDTLRADHLSCYGYERETSPYIDAFASEGVVFENAVTPETWTLPSHASMFTGLYPVHHGVTANANLAESIVSLPEALREAGYLTAGYTGFTFWLYPWRGFGHGFDLYNTPAWRFRSLLESHDLADAWVDSHAQPNLFLFLHNFDVHAKPAKQFDDLPYGPEDPSFLHFSKSFENPPTFKREGREHVDAEAFLLAVNKREIEITPEESAYCVALYDDAIRMVDDRIHRTFAKLKELGLYDPALIILTADHGEEFGEHGTYGHGNVYEPSAHIPFIVKFPHGKHAGTRNTDVVSLVDIYPTVLDVIGAAADEPVDGQSLLKLLDKQVEPAGEAFIRRNLQHAIRTRDVKLIHDTARGQFELFDMVNDRDERSNLYENPPIAIEPLREQLASFFSVSQDGWHIAFATPDNDWRANLSVTTDETIELAEMLGARDIHMLTMTEGGVDVRLGRTGTDEMLLKTVGATQRISVGISANGDFRVAVGDRPPVDGKSFSVVLDPAVDSLPEPPVDPTAPEDLPTIRIWHVAAAHERTAAQTLSEEAREELEALGYTGELTP